MNASGLAIMYAIPTQRYAFCKTVPAQILSSIFGVLTDFSVQTDGMC